MSSWLRCCGVCSTPTNSSLITGCGRCRGITCSIRSSSTPTATTSPSRSSPPSRTTTSGRRLNLDEVTTDLAGRLVQIFRRDPPTAGGAVFGANDYFQTDPHWRDRNTFHQYFNEDNGSGVGASHQTGWTALVASLLFEYGGQHDGA